MPDHGDEHRAYSQAVGRRQGWTVKHVRTSSKEARTLFPSRVRLDDELEEIYRERIPTPHPEKGASEIMLCLATNGSPRAPSVRADGVPRQAAYIKSWARGFAICRVGIRSK